MIISSNIAGRYIIGLSRLVILLWLFGSAGLALGNPYSVTYSGRLTAFTGSPIEGPVKLQVQFYNQAEGGQGLLTEPILYTNVTLNQGVFQLVVNLEKVTANDFHRIFGSSAKTWIEVTNVFESAPVVYPRQQFSTVPYALKIPVDEKSLTYTSEGKLEVGELIMLNLESEGSSNVARLKAASNMDQNVTYTLPPAPTAGSYLKTDDTGNLSWGSPSGSGDMVKTTYDFGDNGIVDNAEKLDSHLPSYYLNASNISTGTLSEGRLPSNITNAASTVNAATNLNTASTIVKRDGSGSFAAGTISGNLIGNVTGNVSGSAASFTGFLSGDVAGTQGATAIATGAVTLAKIAACGDGKILKMQGVNWTCSDDTAYGWGNHASAGYLTSVPWATPGTIGSTTPSTGVFTTVTGNTALKLKDGDTNYATIKANNAMSADVTFTFPAGAGTSGQVLATDGSGNLSWAAQGSAPVTSVNTLTGAVTLTTTNISEGTNLYYTDARAKTAAVGDVITDAVTDKAPSQNAVFDALALKSATSHAHADATTSASGFMSAADKTKLNGVEAGADITDAANVAAAGAIMDGDFSANGIMTRTGAGTYSSITDSSANWNTAYGWGNHASAGYAASSHNHNGTSPTFDSPLVTNIFVSSLPGVNRWITDFLNQDVRTTASPSFNAVTAASFSGSGASLTSLNGANISDGTVPKSKLSGSGCGSSEIMKWNGSAWVCTTPSIAAETQSCSAGASWCQTPSCSAGYTVSGGGGKCHNSGGTLRQSYQSGNTWVCDCGVFDGNNYCYAICHKINY